VGRIPGPSEKVDVWELTVEIESVENSRVASAIVTPPRLDDEGDERDEVADARGAHH
jgi:hypothetical protein